MGKRRLLDFSGNVSDVKQINPLFSTCKVRVMYTGLNRNMSYISKDSVERALPTIKNIPIVGEFSESVEDFKGHGGKIDLDTYKFIHTTKPYGIVPESATYDWESIDGKEYLTIDGCYLWTGRYEEANSIIKNGKGQSMEIEVTDGQWNEKQEAYQINDFIFTALCILGDDVEPAFENAKITAYSLDKDSFKKEFSLMMNELKESLQDKEDNKLLEELLKKYNLTTEQLEEKGIDYKTLADKDLEAKMVEVFGKAKTEDKPEDNEPEATKDEHVIEKPKEDPETKVVEKSKDEPSIVEPTPIVENIDKEHPKANVVEDNLVPVTEKPLGENSYELRVKELEKELEFEKEKNKELSKDNELLKAFKLETEKTIHEEKASEMFERFKLTNEDVDGLDIHKFSLEELEEKCFAILGRKTADKKNFTKVEDNIIKVPLNNKVNNDIEDDGYGGLFKKFSESN